MEQMIRIDVKGKIAKKTCDTVYVCGNSDYTAHFTFDEGWDKYPVKTARFVPKGQPPIDVVFEGDDCPVPVMANVYGIDVGVYAGDLITTTPAYLPAKKSILCGSDAPQDPPKNVYDQIMEKVNEAVKTADDVEKRANAGEFNGKDGADVTAQNISAALGYTPAKQEDVNSLNEDMAKLDGGYELIETIELKEDSTLYLTKEPDGTSYKFKKVKIQIFVPSSNQVATYANCLVYGSTGKYAVFYIPLEKGKTRTGYIEVCRTGDVWDAEYTAITTDLYSYIAKLNGSGYENMCAPGSFGEHATTVFINTPMPAGTVIMIQGVRA